MTTCINVNELHILNMWMYILQQSCRQANVFSETFIFNGNGWIMPIIIMQGLFSPNLKACLHVLIKIMIHVQHHFRGHIFKNPHAIGVFSDLPCGAWMFSRNAQSQVLVLQRVDSEWDLHMRNPVQCYQFSKEYELIMQVCRPIYTKEGFQHSLLLFL